MYSDCHDVIIVSACVEFPAAWRLRSAQIDKGDRQGGVCFLARAMVLLDVCEETAGDTEACEVINVSEIKRQCKYAVVIRSDDRYISRVFIHSEDVIRTKFDSPDVYFVQIAKCPENRTE